MNHVHASMIIAEVYERFGLPNLFVKYWGFDPDDIDMNPDCEDGLTGSYDAYMVPDSEAGQRWYGYWLRDTIREALAKELCFDPMIMPTKVSDTQKYYPDIYLAAKYHSLLLKDRKKIIL